MMRLTILRPVGIAGRGYSPGATVTVPEDDGRKLVALGAARPAGLVAGRLRLARGARYLAEHLLARAGTLDPLTPLPTVQLRQRAPLGALLRWAGGRSASWALSWRPPDVDA